MGKSIWAKFHFAFMKAPLPSNSSWFSKHLHKYVSCTSWCPCVVGITTNCRKSQDRPSGPGLQLKKPVSSYAPCIHEAMQAQTGWVGCNLTTRQIVLRLRVGRSRSYASQGGIPGVSVHCKSRIQFANRTTNSFNLKQNFCLTFILTSLISP